MTESKEGKLDLVQRIAEAVGRKDEPEQLSALPVCEDDTVLGVVPIHLRHLHNLLSELTTEFVEEAGAVATLALLFGELPPSVEAVRSVFFAAMNEIFPQGEKEFASMRICNDWQVVGTPKSEDDEDPLAELFRTIGGGVKISVE